MLENDIYTAILQRLHETEEINTVKIPLAIESGSRIYDFRGVSGDLSEDNPLYGLYRFKKGFNGDFCEFIGELDLILNRPAAFIIDRGQKLYRKLRYARFKRRGAGAE